MQADFETASKKFSEDLKKAKFKNYLDYINKLAPKFSKVIVALSQDEVQFFEEKSHKDVNKYLYDPFLSYQKNFGKLHRPLTCILSYLACTNNKTKNLQDVYAVASSIENFQSAALIHDDIADAASLRRGKPCLHKQIGTELALNIGDYGLSITIGAVLHQLQKSKFSSEKILEILNQLIFMEYMTIEGQAMDLGWATDERFDIKIDDYFVMATKKSAYYSASVPCVLGAICADAPEPTKLSLQMFGEKIGLAFQIRDDLLNITSAADSKQKDLYSDITEGKLTLCAVAALDFANKTDAQKLKSILQSHTKDQVKLKNAVNVMQKTGALDYAEEQAQKLCNEALAIIDDNIPDNQWKQLLLDMACWVKNRLL